MKKISAAILAAVTTISLASCSGGHKSDSAAASSTAMTTSTAATTSSSATSSTETSSSESSTESSSSTAPSSEAPAGATVKIDGPFGSVDYPVNPKRVVAIGQVAVDNLLSLGVKPAVIMGSAREENIPWQVAHGASGIPFVKIASFKDLKPELIAKYKPDLIVGDAWRVTKSSYGKLSVIAPTLGPASLDPSHIGWKDQLLNLGKIFNATDKAERVIAADKALFQATAADLPGLKGKSGIASQYIGPLKSFGVIAQPMLPANAFFTDLGMVIPPAIVKAPDQQAGRATISAENISLLNADFGLFGPRGASVADMEAVPGFKSLKQVKSGAYVIATKPYLLQAVNQPSALSRAYALKQVLPQLKIAAKG